MRRIADQATGGARHGGLPALQRYIEAQKRLGDVLRATVRGPLLVVWAKRGKGIKSPLDGKYTAFVCKLRAEYELMREVIQLAPLAKRVLWNRVPELAAGAFPSEPAEKLRVLQRVLKVMNQLSGVRVGGFGNRLAARVPEALLKPILNKPGSKPEETGK